MANADILALFDNDNFGRRLVDIQQNKYKIATIPLNIALRDLTYGYATRYLRLR